MPAHFGGFFSGHVGVRMRGGGAQHSTGLGTFWVQRVPPLMVSGGGILPELAVGALGTGAKSMCMSVTGEGEGVV